MKKYFIAAIFGLLFSTAYAHPHMFFTSRVEFIFSGEKLQGAYVTWTFDRFFSADIIDGYDLNKDGVFNAAETSEVYNNAFIYTQNYYFFIFMRQGNVRTSPEHILKSKFSLWQKNGIVSYRFYVDLTAFKGRELYFACYDYTFFCDITYPEKLAVNFICDKTKLNPVYSIVENKNYPVYYNPTGPIDDTTVYYKWAPGLQTYYPREIHIKF
ncbi:DUF1007 family protein [Treponema pedis]|uniref:DUF1007 family protein n=1 Tax=Treponema pedis TaxID=409322 RepID=UPI000402C6EA|nr:DUF1007 family protein [Treponema pedis]